MMDRAESLFGTDDSTALAILDSVARFRIEEPSLNARYALLHSEALYKNCRNVPDDSLIMVAVSFYSEGKDTERQFRSYYMLGCIQSELDLSGNAIVSLGQAEQLASEIDDEYRLGLLYYSLGNEYFSSFDFNHARMYYEKAYDSYGLADKPGHRLDALYGLGRCHLQTADYGLAYQIFAKVRENAEKEGDVAMMHDAMVAMISCGLESNDKYNLDNDVNSYLELYGEPEKEVTTLWTFSRYFISRGQYGQASSLIDRGWQCAADASDSAKLWFAKAELDEHIGLLDSSINEYMNAVYASNLDVQGFLNQPISFSQSDYFKTAAKLESLKAQHRTRTIIFMLVTFVLLAAVLLLITVSRRLRFESDRKELQLTIHELRLKEDSSGDTISRLNSQVNALFSSQFSDLEQMLDKMVELEEINAIPKKGSPAPEKLTSEKLYEHLKAKIEEMKSARNQQQLDRLIDSTFNNLMQRLSQLPVNLSDNDLSILRFSIAGFPVRVISRIMDIASNTIYQKRYRILNRIGKADPAVQDEISGLIKGNNK